MNMQLVWRLSDDEQYRFETFNNLPTNLRTNFNELAAQGSTVGQINVFGAVPGQSATEDDKAFLEQVCRDTETAINQVPTLAPVAAPDNSTDTMSPTQDFSGCRQDMVKSDTSPRNNFLGTTEYTKYVAQ
jgi:hypothetical protein